MDRGQYLWVLLACLVVTAPLEVIFDARVYRRPLRTLKAVGPVVVVFYANQDQQCRHLATLVRYLALEFGDVVAFYGYAASEGATIDHHRLAALQKRYGLKKVPATLFYDNDKGKMELEKSDYSVPTMAEYRTPSPFFWNTYYQATRKYIKENILD